MVYKMKPPEPMPEEPKPPPEQANGTDAKQERRAPRVPTPRPQPLTQAEVDALVAEMHAELAGDTREEARKLRRALQLPAMERLGLVITGRQPTTAPQVVTASVAVLEDDGSPGEHDAGTGKVAE